MMIFQQSSSLSRLLLSVAFAFAFAPTTTASPREEATQNLIDWIVSSEGGEYNSKQTEKTFHNGKNRGIFANQDIPKGEILLRVPWDSILGSNGATRDVLRQESKAREMHYELEHEGEFMAPQCRVIRDLYQEAQKEKDDSDFAIYLRYLSLSPNNNSNSDSNLNLLPQIPAMWSQEARDLLEDMNDHGDLPPLGLFTTLNHNWFGACIKDIENNPLEKKVASTVAAHGSMGKYGILVPLIDNYHYNQVLFRESVNAMTVVEHGQHVSLVAIEDISEGAEIIRSYGEEQDEDSFRTLDMFVESGIIDDEYYPKDYHFDSFAIEVYKNADGTFEAKTIVYDQYHDDDAVEEFFALEVSRLKRIEWLVLENTRASSTEELPPGSTMNQAEWKNLWKYHSNLLQAMELTLEAYRKDQDEDEVCPGGNSPVGSTGSCPIWDSFQSLPNDRSLTLEALEFDETNPYGPSDFAYGLCNDENSDWDGYVKAGELDVLKSQYQDIRFFYHPSTKDMVMKLDGTIQQSSSYRPHYHEFAVHFPARFLENVERVLFVGGGDSMVLHEVLKYPSLKKVVGLELDQFVLRNAFRYFNSQPHFDDKRVEWWFGDGAKSLLMLPKDYFQSFDLVVVDLSETVMSFEVTSQLSIFQTLSLLLKPDGILLKNGEYYMEKMSEYFDYTLQYFEYDVPFICDQGMVIGSNKIDFFNRTMKDHGVELLVLESQEEINEKFDEYYRFTEYRKNDARKQGQCENVDYDESGIKNAGILMVVEAENVKHDLHSIEAVEKTIGETLKDVGFSILSTVNDKSSTLVIVTNEGYVTARLHPEKSYVGLDIKLWANFDLMEPARDALVQSLGGSDEGTSSFRIVTGGMSGSPYQELDRSKIGPRMINSRNCEPASSPASETKMVDLKESGLQSSLGMVEDDVVAAVLCGSKEEACESLEILMKAPPSKFLTVLPIYTCDSMESQDAEFSLFLDKKMARCEVELSNALGSTGHKISLLVVDNSAKQIMGKTLLSLFSSVWNRKRLFSQHRFVALVEDNTFAWHKNLLVLIREKIVYKPMSLVNLVLDNSTDKSKISILSLGDKHFFLHLKEMVEAFKQANGEAANMKVDKVFDGLPAPQVGHFNPKIFKADAYDPTPAQEQHAGQSSQGRQSLVQFETTRGNPKLTVEVIESALNSAIASQGGLEFTSFKGNASIGDGLVVVAFSVDGATQAILSWDGKTHIDANLYSIDENPKLRKSFIDSFVKSLGKAVPIKVTLSDTHPRGVGRVVSFPGHMN